MDKTGQMPLKPQQRKVLETAMEPGIGRNIVAVCDAAGVPRSTFYRWLEDDEFRDAWNDAWYGSVRRHMPGVVAAMIEKAQSGDVAAGRLVADLAGVIISKSQQEQSGEVKVIIEYADADG